MKKEPPYNFGISQEDALTESKALSLIEDDRLLCIASAGEIPLNLLALHNIHIVACDTSIEQIFLSKLKVASILYLDQERAAKLIGFYKCDASERWNIYSSIKDKLTKEEQTFWETNKIAIYNGIINEARFEKYILKFSWILRLLLGKRKLIRLMQFKSIEEQQHYFDLKISNIWIKALFKIAFHPKVYKNRGMDEHGLQHQKDSSVASFFYNRFRDFCTSTLTSVNFYFQYTFFNQILNKEALPEYLSEDGMENIRNRKNQLSFDNRDFTSVMKSNKKGYFNKFHLSNIGDWLSTNDMNIVFETLYENGAPKSKFILRYIHLNHKVPNSIAAFINVDKELGDQLVQTDRYPFYNIIPGTFNC